MTTMIGYLAIFVIVWMAISVQGAVNTDPVRGVCMDSTTSKYSTAFIYSAALRTCVACPGNSTAVVSAATLVSTCVCNAGFVDVGLGIAVSCSPCAAGTAPRTAVYGTCFPCGSVPVVPVAVDVNVTCPGATLTPAPPINSSHNATNTTGSTNVTSNVPSAPSGPDTIVTVHVNRSVQLLNSPLQPSTYDSASMMCTCPAGQQLTDTIAGQSLDAFYCTPCTGGNCADCGVNHIWDATTSTCICSTGHTLLVDGTCAPSAAVSAVLSAVGSRTNSLSSLNYNGGGQGGQGPAVQSYLIQNYLAYAGYGCQLGNATACNLLANLCVLSNYQIESAACSVYLTLQNEENCHGIACEVPVTVPWLYYLRGSPDLVDRTTITDKMALRPRDGYVNSLPLLMATYAWDGTFLGNVRVTDQLQLCDIPGADAAVFYRVGANRRVSCQLDLRWFLASPKTVFYELFYMDAQGTLHDIPALLDYGNNPIDPANNDDSVLYRTDISTDGTPTQFGYKRRFYMYDNIGSVSSPGGNIQTVTYARRVLLLVTLQPSGSLIYDPILVIQYASTSVSNLYTVSDLQFQQLRELQTNRTGDRDGTVSISMDTKYTMNTFRSDQALMITLITICCVCFFSGWIRTYGWMRRQQDTMLGFGALIRYFLYLCNHVSNLFSIVVFIASGFFYLLYKHQYDVEYMLPQTNIYLFAMLYTALACKGAYCIFRIVEQTNTDFFVIDWERSRGMLLRENKDVGVTMWRSTFIANELNEMQTYRLWDPLFSMLVMLCFMEGLGYTHLADAVPEADDYDSGYTYPDATLRVAIGGFFWIVVPLTFYFIVHQVYYRFISTPPLRAFVDLCSVSNISVLVLLERQWGFYIHGESIHAHSDASIEEFQDNLRREAQGNLPQRGLGGIAECQTFEIFIGAGLRHFMDVCYFSLNQEHIKTLQGAAGPVHAGHHRKCFDFIFGMPGHARAMTDETLAIKHRLNEAFTTSIRSAESTLLAKAGPHAWFDFPPNIMYMNGPFSGENAGKDLFFLDRYDGYGRAMLAGLDLDLWLLYALFFVAVDSTAFNVYLSFIVVYILECLLVAYRSKEGTSNLGSKTLFDDRFFL